MENETPSNGTASDANPAELALQLYRLLAPVSSELRHRAIQATLAALGETPMLSARASGSAHGDSPLDGGELSNLPLGPKAMRWLQRNSISRAVLDEVFHVSEGGVDITASHVPGASKKEMTINCYLLVGVRGLLATDTATLDDSETIALCKRLTAYDKNNHPAYRTAVGNKMIGSKPTFTLTGPGENAAAQVIKAIANREENQSGV